MAKFLWTEFTFGVVDVGKSQLFGREFVSIINDTAKSLRMKCKKNFRESILKENLYFPYQSNYTKWNEYFYCYRINQRIYVLRFHPLSRFYSLILKVEDWVH